MRFTSIQFYISLTGCLGILLAQCLKLDWRSLLEAARCDLSRHAWCNGNTTSTVFVDIYSSYWTSNNSSLLAVSLLLQVHHGFYTAYYNTTLRFEILKSIKWARKTYGKLPINVVGHSMGGALASFCALDLSVCTFRPSGYFWFLYEQYATNFVQLH
jgi:putative lipase involved disintegration of autophagic bodies